MLCVLSECILYLIFKFIKQVRSCHSSAQSPSTASISLQEKVKILTITSQLCRLRSHLLRPHFLLHSPLLTGLQCHWPPCSSLKMQACSCLWVSALVSLPSDIHVASSFTSFKLLLNCPLSLKPFLTSYPHPQCSYPDLIFIAFITLKHTNI